jgi:urease alpha subunit
LPAAASATRPTKTGARCRRPSTPALVADELIFLVQLYADTVNESGYMEDTLEAIEDRTIHQCVTPGQARWEN